MHDRSVVIGLLAEGRFISDASGPGLAPGRSGDCCRQLLLRSKPLRRQAGWVLSWENLHLWTSIHAILVPVCGHFPCQLEL